MYYEENKTQQEIAHVLGISRVSISRYLLQAKNEGIVKIRINNPYSNESVYSEKLSKIFNDVNFYVVDSSLFSNNEELYREIANELSTLLRHLLKNESILGVSAGKTLGNVVKYLDPMNLPDLTVIPLLGGEYMTKTHWQANVIAREIAQKFNADTLQLYAPFRAINNLSKDLFISEPANKAILEKAKNTSVAIIGIGNIISNPNILLERLLTKDDLDELIDKNVVANICCSLLNEAGETVKTNYSDELIGISGDDLKKIPNTIGIATGKEKAISMLSTLKGSWVNSVVIDTDLAKELLKIIKEESNH